MEYVFGLIIFLFGAALGSFINVIADRFNTGLSPWKGRSFCFSCSTVLRRSDLVPLFSFLFLRGKCRYCRSKIPVSAFVVEILMGLLSLLAAYQAGIFENFQFSIFNFQFFPSFLILTSIFATLLLITIYDLRHFIIPDTFLLIFLLFSFLYNSHFVIFDSSPLSFARGGVGGGVVSGIFLALPFLLIFLISRGRWIGFGDIKYIAVIGFFLGFAEGLSAVIFSFWIGAAFSLLALVLRKIKPHIYLPLMQNKLTIKSEIPFGPFLSLGTVLSFYFNADIFQINSLLQMF